MAALNVIVNLRVDSETVAIVRPLTDLIEFFDKSLVETSNEHVSWQDTKQRLLSENDVIRQESLLVASDMFSNFISSHEIIKSEPFLNFVQDKKDVKTANRQPWKTLNETGLDLFLQPVESTSVYIPRRQKHVLDVVIPVGHSLCYKFSVGDNCDVRFSVIDCICSNSVSSDAEIRVLDDYCSTRSSRSSAKQLITDPHLDLSTDKTDEDILLEIIQRADDVIEIEVSKAKMPDVYCVISPVRTRVDLSQPIYTSTIVIDPIANIHASSDQHHQHTDASRGCLTWQFIEPSTDFHITCRLVFDNSYSMINGKYVSYAYQVVPSDALNAALTAQDELSVLESQVSNSVVMSKLMTCCTFVSAGIAFEPHVEAALVVTDHVKELLINPSKLVQTAVQSLYSMIMRLYPMLQVIISSRVDRESLLSQIQVLQDHVIRLDNNDDGRVDGLEMEVDLLRQQLASKSREVMSLSSQVIDLQHVIETINDDNDDDDDVLQLELESVKQEMSDHVKRVAELSCQLSHQSTKSQSEVTELGKRHRLLLDQDAANQIELDRLRCVNAEQEVKIRRMDNERLSMVEEIEGLYAQRRLHVQSTRVNRSSQNDDDDQIALTEKREKLSKQLNECRIQQAAIRSRTVQDARMKKLDEDLTIAASRIVLKLQSFPDVE